MMCWSDHLCKARIELLEGHGDDRERLENAAREFARALAARNEWPMGMKAWAGSLRSRLTSSGSVGETIAGMDEATLRDVSDGLWRFCEVAEPCPWEGPAAEVRGIEHLREAREALYGPQGTARDRLLAAAQQFWTAAFHVESWPETLRTRAESLSAKIFRHGKIEESVSRMGDKTAAEVSQELLGLCDDAEQFDAPPSPRRPEPHGTEPRRSEPR